jgi:carboxyl-terminal processing protease
MRKPWRVLALLLFGFALVFGGVLGENLLALTDVTRDNLRLYTELISIAHDRYGSEVSYKDLVYSSIQGMLRTLDPHTNFLPPRAYSSMREKQQGSFYGLGIFVGMRDGQLTVITPIPGTPAARMGMRAGDIISLIEGEPTDTLSLDEAVRRLKGPKGTQVNVTLIRRGMNEPIELDITRAEIPQTTVQYAYMLDEQTGYLNIRDFSRSTGSEVARAVKRLKDEGMRRLLLDVRNNGGGLLDQAIEVADQFVPGESKIVETRGRTRSSENDYVSSGSYEPLGLPLVVLVNTGTASAAEILAGAIQDHDIGLIVGEPTWGKGLVQTVYTLPYGAGLALTTARYYTPSGRLIQRDYSSYWDYYTHDLNGDQVAVEEPAPETTEVFLTDLGRKVYGGGGITPDVTATPGETPSFLQYLLSRSAFFRFSVDFNSRHELDSPLWQPTPEILDEFEAWLQAEELTTEEDLQEEFSDPHTRRLAQARIRHEILNSAFGLTAGHRAFAETDVQMQKGLELFDQAAELLQARQSSLQEATTPLG